MLPKLLQKVIFTEGALLWTRETFVKFVPETVGEEQARKNDMPPESAVLTRGGKILAGCKQKARACCSTAESYFIYLLVSQKKKIILTALKRQNIRPSQKSYMFNCAAACLSLSLNTYYSVISLKPPLHCQHSPLLPFPPLSSALKSRPMTQFTASRALPHFKLCRGFGGLNLT